VFFFSACIDHDYDLDNIDEENVFSHEKGIYMYLGNFDSIHFTTIEVGNIEEVKYIKNIEGLFSEGFYESFVITKNNKEEAIGAIAFEADFLPSIKDAESKDFSDVKLSIEITDEDGENTGIVVNDQTFDVQTNEAQPFSVLITKEDVLKLKKAHTLRLIFTFSAKKIESDDYLLIKDTRVRSYGGIKI
jgi:hypothetical protein